MSGPEPLMHHRIEAAYRQEHERLWRSLVGYCRDVDLATDAALEAWTQAIRRGDAIKDPVAWVWKAAFKIAAGMLMANVAHLPLDGTVKAERCRIESVTPLVDLLDLLEELSDQQRACVVLQHVGGLRAVEIAEVLGTTPTTVRVQLHRAHRKLHPTLASIQEIR